MKTDTSQHAGESTPLPRPSRPAEGKTRKIEKRQGGIQEKFKAEKTAIGCTELSPG